MGKGLQIPLNKGHSPSAGPLLTGQMHPQPVVTLAIGMAGSGKTTVTHRLSQYLRQNDQSTYLVNLDPALLPTQNTNCNLDIRDTVDYARVMEQYGLGPNGAILTCLNLFATRFDQVLDLLKERSGDLDAVCVDTPGQIEIFTWSASGAIIAEALKGTFPTVVVYVVDSERCASPLTFMSNMLHACSILYRCKLPFVLVFNKIDLSDCKEQLEWMRNFEALQLALAGDSSYSSTLVHSMSLVLEEFYSSLPVVAVSAVTGEGFSELAEAIRSASEDGLGKHLEESLAITK